MFSFLVIVQLGTLISLFAFYGKDLLSILRATLDVRRASPERNLGLYIIVATIPALVAGFLLKDAIEALFEQPMLQASIRLFAAAILLTLAEALTRKDRSLESMTGWDALLIGVMQIISVFPGASRSGTTISGGMFRGFDRPSAARFAFLMSVPVLLAAGGYEMLDVIQMPNLGEFLPLLLVGFITAAIVGWFAIRWLIAYLSKHSLYVFAAYCAILGTLVFFLR
jgi:undecaprenyl-diphosphatase